MWKLGAKLFGIFLGANLMLVGYTLGQWPMYFVCWAATVLLFTHIVVEYSPKKEGEKS